MRISFFLLTTLLFRGLSFISSPDFAQPPVPVILDTDMDSDVDDVGALAMLHAYERAGKVNILGVIVTSDEVNSAACTDAINTFFGRGTLPIGVSQRDSLKSFSKYTQAVAQAFPHQITNRTAEAATSVYRRLLAAQPDGSVVIITIGHLTSLSRLLHSGPDAASPLDGRALVARKVKRWSCMGGQFPNGKEANFYRPDPASTVDCLSTWTLPVTFAGWEVGQQIVTGGSAFRERCSAQSPVYRGYEQYNGFQGRASWDQVAVLEAVEGLEPYFSAENGQCVVAADGSNQWQPTSQTNHRYLKIKGSPEAIQKRIETLMLGGW
ncbi:nucleoside hydrolase [Larkinella insperata]|uniref:Nucleoside hydrolase n=1 Tax=Larkinella insperata TaxID=332158 RepID=A0ABW3QBZ8_9BACT|nr:nucleoside hydrolase [Larkinella insperata]